MGEGREFDIFVDGSRITFQEAWKPLKVDHISLFLEIPVTGVVTMLTTMFLFHIFGSTCILKLMKNQGAISDLILEGFHTLIAPPLHFDWEMCYRLSDGTLPIKQCWMRLIIIDNISKCIF